MLFELCKKKLQGGSNCPPPPSRNRVNGFLPGFCFEKNGLHEVQLQEQTLLNTTFIHLKIKLRIVNRKCLMLFSFYILTEFMYFPDIISVIWHRTLTIPRTHIVFYPLIISFWLGKKEIFFIYNKSINSSYFA